MCTNEKAMQTFLQHLRVPLWHVVKSSEVVMDHNPWFMCELKG